MTTRIREFLENSRIAATIADVELGNEIDWAKLGKLQTLDLARIGELFLLDQLDAEDLADGVTPPNFID